MLINSFENQTKLAEWFEHRNHYSVVVTCHKDLERTEYKIQKNDYVYDMLKVKGSVTALVTCAKSLANNFPPTTTTDNKTVATGEQVGVVDSVGDALFPFVAQTDNFQPLDNLVLDVDGRKYSLTIADLRTIGNALQIYHNHNSETDWGWDDETNEKEIKLKHISDLRDQFRNIQNYYSVEHQAWIQACENGSIFAESGIFDKAE